MLPECVMNVCQRKPSVSVLCTGKEQIVSLKTETAFLSTFAFAKQTKMFKKPFRIKSQSVMKGSDR